MQGEVVAFDIINELMCTLDFSAVRFVLEDDIPKAILGWVAGGRLQFHQAIVNLFILIVSHYISIFVSFVVASLGFDYIIFLIFVTFLLTSLYCHCVTKCLQLYPQRAWWWGGCSSVYLTQKNKLKRWRLFFWFKSNKKIAPLFLSLASALFNFGAFVSNVAYGNHLAYLFDKSTKNTSLSLELEK